MESFVFVVGTCIYTLRGTQQKTIKLFEYRVFLVVNYDLRTPQE